MKNMDSIISTLEEIGLLQTANTLKSIQSLRKTAETDFSKEREVIRQLLAIIQYFQDKPLTTVVKDPLSFPPYSLETANRYVVYSGDDLSNYSKKEVLTVGLPNFLNSFIDKYMEGRLKNLSGPDARRYEKVIQELSNLRRNIKKEYDKISSPPSWSTARTPKVKRVSREDISKDLRRLTNVFSDMTHFQIQIQEKYVPLLAHHLGYVLEEDELVEEDDFPEPEAPSQTQPTVELVEEEAAIDLDESDLDEELQKEASYYPPGSERQLVKDLLNLTYDFDDIRDRVDSKYAKRLDMPVDEFRKFVNLDNLLVLQKRAAEDILEKFKSVTERFEGDEQAKQDAEARKMAQDIIKGLVGYEKSSPKQKGEKRKKTFVLFAPDKVMDAWEYLQKDLAIKYEALVSTIVDLTTARQRSVELLEKQLTPETRKEQELRDTVKKENRSKEVDQRIAKELYSVLEALR